MKKARRARIDKDKILRRMQRRLIVVFGIVCVLFVGLIARLMYIQYTSGDKFEKKVLSQMSYDSRVIPYQRGNITDKNGAVLATSVDVYNLILDCKLLNENDSKIDSTINYINKFYSDITPEIIKSNLTEKPDSQYIVLKKDISFSDMNKLNDVMTDEKTSSEIEGVWFEKEFKREYPYGNLAAATIGFASGDGNGAIGLENGYNSTLNGINGRAYGYLNDDNNFEKSVMDAQNGSSIVTTLDINIQSIVEDAILDYNNKLKEEANNDLDGSANTAVLVMDPRDNSVLAMADYPTFDLNNPRDLSNVYTKEQLDNMDADEQLDALNRLWQNFTITHTFEPGSTFKPFTVACGLETGTLRGDEVYICDGYEEIGEHKIHCVNTTGHGTETIEKALVDSCNDALMQMSYSIGGDNFKDYQELFGFGQRTNIDLTGEARTDNVVFKREDLQKKVNLATNSFGQSFNVTMIQLASAFSSLINGGNLYQPYIVGRIEDDKGNVVEQINPVVQKQTVSKETSDLLKSYLKTVVTSGTGAEAGVDGYSIGGKTGTAEKAPRNKTNYLVSFIGFAPVEDPQVLVYVVVDEPNVADQAHSTYAQEIAHNIFEQILPYLNIAQTEPIVPHDNEESTDVQTQENNTASDTTEDAGDVEDSSNVNNKEDDKQTPTQEATQEDISTQEPQQEQETNEIDDTGD